MFVIYHPGYTVDLGPNHRFPMQKYRLVYERLLAEGTLAQAHVIQPGLATMADLLLVHTRDYVDRFLTGEMSTKEMRLLGFPWSEPLALRARLATQGTLTASLLAWKHGLASNLAGGSHHAFADHGEGFSVFNDIAVAIRVLQRDHGLQRAAIIDCDVHQGNGTAAIFTGDASVFTCSLHGAKNYPFRKAQSSLDLEFSDGTEDAAYLAALQTHLPAVLERFEPQMVWYLAGVDPYVGDKLGRLALTLKGLLKRDAYVLSTCCRAGIPVVTTMGGGYASHIEDIVEGHCQTVRLASQMAARPETIQETDSQFPDALVQHRRAG